MKRINRHTHPGNTGRIEVMQALSVLRNRAMNTMEQTSHVIATSLENMSQAGKGSLPTIVNLKRSPEVPRKRGQNVCDLGSEP